MKPLRKWRFQFGLRTVLIVPILVGGVWWWHTWPERTARRFHRYLVEGNVAAAQSMMPSPQPDELKSLWSVSDKAKGKASLTPPRIHSRSLGDWFCARGEFNVGVDLAQKSRYYFGRFVASRGMVIPKGEIETGTLIVYRTQYLSSEVAFDKIKAEIQFDSHARMVANQPDGVLVLAPRKTQGEIKALLRKLDRPPIQGPTVPPQ